MDAMIVPFELRHGVSLNFYIWQLGEGPSGVSNDSFDKQGRGIAVSQRLLGSKHSTT